MHMQYTVMDPTKNITLLVTSPVPRDRQRQAAAALLAREAKAEQVGFLEYAPSGGKRLQMMGGEFCGNATMSYGAWLCRREGLAAGESRELLLEVSGIDAPVSCTIAALPGCFTGTVTMPLPERIAPVRFDDRELPVVFLPGICHIIAPADTISLEEAESLLRRWSTQLPGAAAGLLLFDEARMRMTPLVCVKHTDTIVWEQSCGSGSAAVGAWLTASRQAPQCVSIKQPGGTLAVVTTWDGSALRSLTITGIVEIGCSQEVDLPL